MTHALIAGATSSLAVALCRELAASVNVFTLCGRDAHELDALARDLSIRHAVRASYIVADFAAEDFSAEVLLAHVEPCDIVIILAGDMGENQAPLQRIAAVNYIAPAHMMEAAAHQMQQRGEGLIVAVGSVAGDRGRQSNYPYGSAKAALAAYASGLRNKMHAHGVHIMTVKPGFTDTPMTWGMKSPLLASREHVAKDIAKAIRRKRDTLYTPFFWRYIMLIIRIVPEFIFKRLNL